MYKATVKNTKNSFFVKETFVNNKLVIHYSMSNGTHDMNGSTMQS